MSQASDMTPPIPTPPVQPPLAPNTTAQQDLTTSGQRRVNLIWESTQSLVALSVTGAVIFCAVNVIESDMLTNAFFLIVGFYFGRTNHSAIGGIGAQPRAQEYRGR